MYFFFQRVTFVNLMNRIYFDNAATTPLDEEVLNEMLPYLKTQYGNASTIYSLGREARMAIEKQRKNIARNLHAKPGEIFFTSCGTESSNTAIQAACRDLGCRQIITSPIEHHATLHSVQHYGKQYACSISYLKLTSAGHIDYEHLESLLSKATEKCLVTLMHANNEIGNVTDIQRAGILCKKYNAIFHTDAVQSVGHLSIELDQLYVHFLSASAHKFHGPKGAGLLYINQEIKILPFVFGGAQERNMRAGTENVANIVGFGKALEIAYTHLESHRLQILELKKYCIEKLKTSNLSVQFHGDIEDSNLYTVLNIGLPLNEKTEMLSINLDMAGICVSGGSACSSGAEGGSHVIKEVYPQSSVVPIRLSFSKYNRKEEIDFVIKNILELV